MMMLGVGLERLGDLDHLPLAWREPVERHVGGKVEARPRRAAPGLCGERLAIDERQRPEAPPAGRR